MDHTDYIAGHRRRRAAEDAALGARAANARQLAEHVAALLVTEFGAQKVVLFGSLACGRFGLRSDIDLAASGIEPARFFAASAAAQRAGEPFDVDLVPLEAADALLQSHLAREGVVLHGD